MFRDRLSWYLGFSSYWFAVANKWFLALVLIPAGLRQTVHSDAVNSTWGTIVVIGAVEAIIGPALWGWISDIVPWHSWRRRGFLIIGTALTVCAALMLAHAYDYRTFFAGYIVLQIGDDVATGPYAAILPDCVPKDRRNKAAGFMGTAQTSSQLLGAVLLATGLTSQPLFTFIALSHTATMIWATFTIGKEDPLPIREKTGVSFLAPLAAANFRWVWLTRFGVSSGSTILATYALNYIVDMVRVFQLGPIVIPRGKATQAVGLIIIATALSASLTAIPVSRLAQKIDRRIIVRGALTVMALSLAPFGLVRHYPTLIIFGLVFGMAFGAYNSMDWALASDNLPDGHFRARDMGLWQGSISLPQLWAGMIGVGIDQINSRNHDGSGYVAAFVLAGVMVLIGSQLVMNIRPDLETAPA